ALNCCLNWCLRPSRSLTCTTRPTPFLPRAKRESCKLPRVLVQFRLLFVTASRPSEFETAFADLVQQRADALVVSSAVSLLTDPDQIVALAARHAVPAIYAWRRSMAVGGLLIYATNLADAWGRAGVY